MIAKGVLLAIGLWVGFNIVVPIFLAALIALADDFLKKPGETLLRIVFLIIGFFILFVVF